MTVKYPPTFLIHGTKDTDVPYAESKNMAAALAKSNVTHEFITVPGPVTGCPERNPSEVTEIAKQAAEYIKTHTS